MHYCNIYYYAAPLLFLCVVMHLTKLCWVNKSIWYYVNWFSFTGMDNGCHSALEWFNKVGFWSTFDTIINMTILGLMYQNSHDYYTHVLMRFLEAQIRTRLYSATPASLLNPIFRFLFPKIWYVCGFWNVMSKITIRVYGILFCFWFEYIILSPSVWVGKSLKMLFCFNLEIY